MAKRPPQIAFHMDFTDPGVTGDYAILDDVAEAGDRIDFHVENGGSKVKKSGCGSRRSLEHRTAGA